MKGCVLSLHRLLSNIVVFEFVLGSFFHKWVKRRDDVMRM